MRTLFVDGARREPVIGLFDGPEVVAQRTLPRAVDDPRGRQVIGSLQALLAEHGLQPGDLRRLAVGIGPGPLSGTRLGMAVVLGLARVLDLPVVGVPAWFGYAEPARSEPQTIRLPLDPTRIAAAEVTPASDAPWVWANARLEQVAAASPVGEADSATIARAVCVGQAIPARDLRPVYLRAPDVLPQFDALGRPLAAGGVA